MFQLQLNETSSMCVSSHLFPFLFLDAAAYTVGKLEGTISGSSEVAKFYLKPNDMFRYDGRLGAFEIVARDAGTIDMRVRNFTCSHYQTKIRYMYKYLILIVTNA